ncbi:MAG: SOS response-associated peptidase [Pseudomonadales bacterium]|nr:SOS response-associated peptidase [Pseudomonadales bacterium]
MCGRFSVTSDPLTQLLMALVGLVHPGPDNLNVAPTETVPVLRLGADGEPQLVPMRWWLTPFWSKELSTKYSMYNAKSETAATSAAFKTPYQKQRCVVPISGFYEWCREHGQKVPYFIAPKSQDGMLLAGLWDRWRVPDGTGEYKQEFLSFTILTTAAHRGMEVVHHRQPVMLSNEEAIAWLDMGQATADLAYLFASRLPHALEVVPVSTHVNNARNKDDRCIQAIGHGVHIPAAVSTINASEERQ